MAYRTPSHSYRGGISRYAGRSTRRYKKDRATFRAACAAHVNHDGTVGAPCWLCGRPIDYSLPDQHPEGFNLDHALTVSAHPELAEDPANYRPSHKDCNERRGDDDPFIQLGNPSEDW